MNNNVRDILKNILYAFGAQAISLILSIVMSLIVPKMLGVEDYSYWQLYLFYSSYVGFFHFGILDGIYLRLGGTKYEDLNHSIIGSQMKLMVLAQIIIASIIVCYGAFFIRDGQREFVIMSTAISMIIINLSSFMGYVFQLTNQTKIYSVTIMLEKITFLFFVASLLIVRFDTYKILILLYIISKLCALIYSIYKARKLFFSKIITSKEILIESLTNIRVGISLMLSNTSGMLVLGIGRLIIDDKWGITAFGKFSFALSITNLFLTFISQVSMVLFPALRQSDDKQLKKFYLFSSNLLSILSPGILLLYFPAKILLEGWFPQYSDSIKYMGVLLPLCTFDGKMNILCFTYLKVLRKEKILLIINIMTMMLSTIMCIVGALIFDNITITILFMVIALGFRSVISEVYLSNLMNASISVSLLQEIFISIIFLVSNWCLDPLLAYLLFSATFVIYVLLNKSRIKEIMNIYHSVMKNY